MGRRRHQPRGHHLLGGVRIGPGGHQGRDASVPARPPPFGDYLCAPDSEIHHIHGTSGTTGTPTAFAVSRHDWDTIANNHARIMWGMGLRPGDTVFIAAVFSLYLGSWGALSGAERLHCKAFPFGAGARA